MDIFLNDIISDLRFTIQLEQDASPGGTYISPDTRMTQIDNTLLAADDQTTAVESFVITGRTDSKFYALENSIKTLVIQDPIVTKQVGNQFGEFTTIQQSDISKFLNVPIRINGTNITATITTYNSERKEYTLYSDTEFPIRYIDFPDGTTTFMFSKIAEEVDPNAPLINKFLGLVEEPKIESSVFIERGIVNVYESFTKLKKVKSLNEMTKFGFGYFKMNKQGFNF
jgi:hypothetical protein